MSVDASACPRCGAPYDYRVDAITVWKCGNDSNPNHRFKTSVRCLEGQIDHLQKFYERELNAANSVADMVVVVEGTIRQQAAEIERLRERNADLERSEAFLGVVSFQLDRIEQHIKDGKLVGDGKWRVDELVAAIVKMQAAMVEDCRCEHR